MEKIRAKDRLIFALDVSEVKQARDLVEELDGLISHFKVGLELHLAGGREFVEWVIKEKGKRVLLDLKFYDIAETVKRATKQAASLGAKFITVHGNSKIIKAAAEGRGATDMKILVVTLLTSLDAQDVKDFYGLETTVEKFVLARARAAIEAGCDGVIASGGEARAIREKIGNDRFLIVTPGIRPRSSNEQDHKRVTTPAEAIDAGADYLVVGRPIRDARDRCGAAKAILEEMQAAFDRRAS